MKLIGTSRVVVRPLLGASIQAIFALPTHSPTQLCMTFIRLSKNRARRRTNTARLPLGVRLHQQLFALCATLILLVNYNLLFVFNDLGKCRVMANKRSTRCQPESPVGCLQGARP